MRYSIYDIKIIIGGSFLKMCNPDTIIKYLLLDSRKLLFPFQSLFFSLSSSSRSGNNYINELYKKGVKNFIVDKTFKLSSHELIDATILQVDNVLTALQKLVIHHREKYSLPVIGITGSNGKTVVKEWLYQLLHEDFSIVRSPKSYNSQIGVPLSVWQINEQHTLGIFEAGISLPSEMEKLEEVIQPSIGIFTNIGEAHNEGFDTIQQKITEKLKLFKNSKVLIYNKDSLDKYLNIEENKNLFNSGIQFFSWGKTSEATLLIKNVRQHKLSSIIRGIYKNIAVEIIIPFTDNASVENAIACWCYLLYTGYNLEIISKKMKSLNPIQMRLELKDGNNNCSIINDSYSADINSLIIALDFLLQQKQHPKRTLILSDILQTGKNDDELYKDVAAILQQKNIDRLIGVGNKIFLHQNNFNNIQDKIFYPSTEKLIVDFKNIQFYNESILLKGARVFEFEKIAHLLESKAHQTVLEINLNAIAHNLKQYQKQLMPNVKVMAMVKAFSYGSGSFEIANLLQFHKVDYLAVAYTDEGVTLRKAGIELPIMVMNVEKSAFHLLVKYNLEPEIFSFSILTEFKNYLESINIDNYPVHIKLDTGMHRLGFTLDEIVGLSDNLMADDLLKVKSVFSHLAGSDNTDLDLFTQAQADIFKDGCQLLQDKLKYNFLKHIGNTAAIHRHKNLQLDMVRLGIGLYGIDSEKSMQEKLMNIGTLKTTIAQIKKIRVGDTVGYGRKGVVNKDIVIATVRIGYADGYSRSMGNGVGYMLVNGIKAPVIGNVCMDMVMLDITGIDANEGDEVIVFGQNLPVTQIAQWAGTIPYEILTGISQRVKRIYFEE